MSKRKTEGITEPQARTLGAICQILDNTGLPPTVKELAEALGISHASAHEQITQWRVLAYCEWGLGHFDQAQAAAAGANP